MARGTFTFEGKRYDVTAKNGKELAAKIALRKRDLEEGRTRITKNTLFKDWAKQWLITYKEPSVSPATLEGYRGRLKSAIYPVIGSMMLKDIKPLHCQKVLNNQQGFSKDYISKVYNTMNQIFNHAQSNQLILSNPCNNLEFPKAEDGTHREITPTERKYFLQVTSYHEYGLWGRLMLYCGLRPGETALIQGRHIDLKSKILKVDGTKTAAANRELPIPDDLLIDLQKIKVGKFEYLFKNKSGNQLTKNNRRTMWLALKRGMNIAMGCKVYRNEVLPPYRVADDFVPYCLRHTFCTDLQDAGVPINVAKDLMGHTDISVTSKIYTHRSKVSFDSAAAAINEFHSKCGNGCGSDASNG